MWREDDSGYCLNGLYDLEVTCRSNRSLDAGLRYDYWKYLRYVNAEMSRSPNSFLCGVSLDHIKESLKEDLVIVVFLRCLFVTHNGVAWRLSVNPLYFKLMLKYKLEVLRMNHVIHFQLSLYIKSENTLLC
jgi:hypothetical protein